MGELVAFRSVYKTKRGTLNPGEAAEILFFTGVRFVRVEDDAALSKTRRRRTEQQRQARQRRERTPA